MAAVSSTIQLSLQTVGMGAAVVALKEVGEAVLDTAIKTDRMNMMMTAASGGAKEAALNMDFVRSIANEMGADILGSADAYSKLAASTRGTRLEGEATTQMFESLVAANTKMGGSTEDLLGMINAFSQMVSKGVVSMEELRGQLGDRLPGTMKLAADSMGLTTGELIEMISKGKVLAEDLLPRLGVALNDTYNDGKFDTAQANVNRLNNQWIALKQELVDSEWVNSVIKNLADFISAVNGTIKQLEGGSIGAAIGGALRRGLQQDAALFGADWRNTQEKIADTNKAYIEADQKFQEANRKGDATQSAIWAQRRINYKKYLDEQTKLIGDEIKQKQETAAAVQARAAAAPQATLPTKAPKVRASAVDHSTEKAANDYERMVERFRDLDAQLVQDRDRALSHITSSEIAKIDEVLKIQINAEREKVRNAKLSGEQQIEATKRLAEVESALTKKAETEKVEVVRKAQLKINDFIAESEKIVADAENDKVKQIKLSTASQINAYLTRYDAEIKAAKAAGLETSRLEKEKAAVVAAIQKKGLEDLNRVSGSYWDQLTQRVKDNTSNQGSMMDQFNKGMVDVTMNATDQIANGFAEMAVSGKASWKDMALEIAKQIEMMIAKMLIMWAVQQLVGMVVGGASGGSGGAMSSTGAQNAATITPSFQSGSYANGGAFNNGVEFFADGGIVDNPKYFRKNNGLGMMGEAGPEAIMPLSRGTDGKLGVKTIGSSSTGNVHIGSINVTVQEREDQTSQEQARQIAKAIETAFDKRIVNAQRSGNLLNPTQVQSAF